MVLTSEQSFIMKELQNQMFNSHGRPFIKVVGGYAGTGKTTLICELRKQLEKQRRISVAFLTFTGKASSVLKTKLNANKIYYPDDYIGTIHGFIYQPETKWDKKLKTFVITGWKRRSKDQIWTDLFIIDEASMVSKEIWKDLLSYNRPIIAVGDHGQLPPIGEDFNLMKNADYKLLEIHRQALNSPIIKLSKIAREEGYIPHKIYSPNVFKVRWDTKQRKKIWDNINFTSKDLIILCGFNTTRANINDRIRKKLGLASRIPYPDEKVVCLKNNHRADIMNGQLGRIVWIMPETNGLRRITLEIDDDMYEVLVADKCFGEVQYTMYDSPVMKNNLEKYAADKGYGGVSYFDYGYAISVHKSQGAEWDRVVLLEQRSNYWDDEYYARWLYTAITRAKEKLMIIDNVWI
ncbi:MAG: ATP-dependent RecD-like DNA helicase [Candidatus Thorarchaeota archaeon]